MKTLALVFASILFLTESVQSQSLRSGTISAGAARLDNGSLVNLGQPFVGMTTAGNGSISVTAGFLVAVNQPIPPPPPPPSFTTVALDASVFHLTFSSTSGLTYEIQTSTNLLDWLPIWSTPGTGLTLEFLDSDISKLDARFYRLLSR